MEGLAWPVRLTCCGTARNTRIGSVSAGNSDGLQSRRAPEKKEPGRWALSVVLLVHTSTPLRRPSCGKLQPGRNRSNASSQAQMDMGKRQVASGAGCYLGRHTQASQDCMLSWSSAKYATELHGIRTFFTRYLSADAMHLIRTPASCKSFTT